MSFYGQVFYELGDAFAKFIVKKSALDTAPIEVKAVGTGGGITIEPKNQWITLEGDVANHTIKFGHITGEKGQTVAPLTKHGTEVAGATQLKAADTIAIQKFKYDDAGHVSLDNVAYYKLPISEAEIDIADLKTRMTTLETGDEEQEKRLNEVETLVETYEDRVSTLEDTATTTGQTLAEYADHFNTLDDSAEQFESDIDGLTDLLGARASMTKDTTTSVTKVIGPTDDLLKGLKCDNLSECISSLKTEINNSNSSIGNNATAVRVAIKNLCDILNENNITVDYNSLWEV